MGMTSSVLDLNEFKVLQGHGAWDRDQNRNCNVEKVHLKKTTGAEAGNGNIQAGSPDGWGEESSQENKTATSTL